MRLSSRPTVDFLFGLARNERLVAELAAELAAAEEESKTTASRRAFSESTSRVSLS